MYQNCEVMSSLPWRKLTCLLRQWENCFTLRFDSHQNSLPIVKLVVTVDAVMHLLKSGIILKETDH